MKKLILLVLTVFLFAGCATVSHKNIMTSYQGFGVKVNYVSQVAINPDDIPAFIKAVDKLEKLLRGEK